MDKEVKIVSNAASSTAKFKDGVIDFTAGAVGGVVNVYVGQPFDTIKVKLQTFPHMYGGMIDCLRKTHGDGGVRALFAGSVPSLAAQVGENAVLFCAYGMCQRLTCYLAQADGVSHLSALQNASSGAMASFFSSLVLCPTELVKCRLQAMSEVMKSKEMTVQTSVTRHTPWSVMQHVVHTHGVSGLYRGLTSTLAREMPGYFMFFGGYEYSRSMMSYWTNTDKQNLGVFKTATCGGIAGVCFWASVYPADVVKSKAHVTSAKPRNFLTALYLLARNEGITTLYKGFQPAIIRTFPATAGLFITYEYTKLWMTTYL